MSDDDDRNDTTLSQNFDDSGTIRHTDDPIPSDTPANLPQDHPAFDSNIDPGEVYDEGPDNAAEVNDPDGPGQA